jgi:hypothetical protein
MRRFLVIAAIGVLCVPLALGDWLLDPPGKTLTLYSSNSNDGYSASRGVVFTATSATPIAGIGYYNDVGAGGSATVELWEGVSLNGNTGGTLVASGTANIGGPLGWFNIPVAYNLLANTNYEIDITYSFSAAGNYFYAYDPAMFGDPPFTVGPFDVVDGTMGHNTGNFVMPRMDLVAVPEPAGLLLLGALALLRRR